MDLSKNLKVKFSAQDIKTVVKQIGKKLSIDYKDKNPIFVGILNGSFMFMSDLIREVSTDCEICFIQLKSYDGMQSSGVVEILKDFDVDISNRHVVIVEDIIETGQTLNFLLKKLELIPIKSLKIVSLLVKELERSFNYPIDYIGFEISQEFVVGYGLDFEEKFRHLDSIYTLN